MKQEQRDMPEGAIDDKALLCPLCEYDLRATFEPRCPECGHEFDRALLLAERTEHPYLFDQRQTRIVRPFAKTWIASLLPRRFWGMVNPQMKPVIHRLILYWIINSAVTAVICGVPLGIMAYWDANSYYGFVWAPRAWSWPWFNEITFAELVGPIALFMLWPTLTILVMNVFRTTLRSGAIRQGHLIRWVVYTASFNLFLLPLFVLAGNAFDQIPFRILMSWPLILSRVENRFLAGALVAMPAYCVLLTIGYRAYLRLPHAVATVLLNQIVVWLAFWAILVDVLRKHF
jgi:hypothetical protein